MEEAITALKTAGHTMVPLARNEASSVELANTIVWQYFMLDPSETSMKHILASGEPPIPSIQKTRELVTSVVKQIPLDDVAELNARRKEFKGAWHNIFQSHKLDVVIGPAAQHTAVGHDTFGIVPYTSIWNVLDVMHLHIFDLILAADADIYLTVSGLCNSLLCSLERA
jgi:amidase